MDVRPKIQMVPQIDRTDRRPWGVRLTGTVQTIQRAPDKEPPIATRWHVRLPAGVTFHGRRVASCNRAIIDLKGPSGCPRASLVGRARAVSFADVVEPFAPDVTLINGGPRRIWAHVVLYRPALTRRTLPVALTRTRARIPRYELTIISPFREIAGLPSTLPSMMMFEIGGGRGARRYVTSETACPTKRLRRYSGNFSYLEEVGGAEGSLNFKGWMSCAGRSRT